MRRATTSGRVVHASNEPAPEVCIALAGKGVPGPADLEDAIEAVAQAASALHEATRRRGREWKPGEPEVRLRSPAGVRGGAGWTVLIAVPGFVTARDVRGASEKAARHHEIAKNIRLVPLEIVEPRTLTSRPGRDRLPGQ
ncbi:MAG TPA: hypothetical protein VLT61_11665, partial [Anaeromyxobacteraceae bacterium]|nr:hypothetical protein [Anaeromyxobacteraceae bacterium]